MKLRSIVWLLATPFFVSLTSPAYTQTPNNLTPTQTATTQSSAHDQYAASIAGTVFDPDGKPVAGAEITYRVVPFPNETLRDEMLKTARRIAVPEAFFDAA